MGKMIRVEGFKAFRGLMVIYKVGEDLYIRGDWLYRPDTDCWYCDGSSYPACACVIEEVE